MGLLLEAGSSKTIARGLVCRETLPPAAPSSSLPGVRKQCCSEFGNLLPCPLDKESRLPFSHHWWSHQKASLAVARAAGLRGALGPRATVLGPQ